MPSFEHQEFRDRVARTQARMAESNLDALWVTSPPNMNYLSGYDGWSFYVHQGLLIVPSRPEPIWVGRRIDVACVRHTTYLTDDHIHGYADAYLVPPAHAMTFVADVMKSLGLAKGRIGVEMDTHYFTARAFTTLAAALPDATIVDADRLVNWLRLIKSPREIEYMIEAGRLTDAAMTAGINAIAPGVRHCDVAGVVYQKLISGSPDYYGDIPDYQTMPKGARTDAPHLSWTAEPYRLGEACTLELGANRFRYNAPLARTVFLGKPPAKLISLAQVVGEGLQSALAAVRPGTTCEEVEAIWRATVGRSGLVKESRIGYSVGIGYPPDWGERTVSLMPGDQTVLAPNMTFHLMLGIWAADGGYEISETLRVTERGHACLSTLPRELVVLDA
ncbi:M24 family metallopeptidase [Steroidobacter sp.]|uniref:M24 family metallopeptidase n=1 Tax=Steroidobacter sp. TaxID=1978227 RepID=UPI001A394096|nr:M24 family metallopeptidase [Steroidobacter sp.]MBL8270934.1 M24 family metallopeptidase [Steroidobacter sp.]